MVNLQFFCTLQCFYYRYTLLLFLFEYRAATRLIQMQFPGTAAASITGFELDGDVISLDGRAPLYTESEIDHDGRIRVRIRRSTSSAPDSNLSSTLGITPRASNLSNAEIFSVNTPLQYPLPSSYNNVDNIAYANGDLNLGYRSASPRLSGYASSDAYSLQPTPRASNINEMDCIAVASGNNITPVWVKSPPARGLKPEKSPVFNEVRMMWESPGKYMDDHGKRHNQGTYVFL